MTDNSEWIEQQLDRAGYSAASGPKRVIRDMIERLFMQLYSNRLLSDDERNEAASTFYQLARGFALVPETVPHAGRWLPFELGTYPVNSTVRVKNDAYAGEAGKVHNGRIGTFVGARGGEVAVQYGNTQQGMGNRHLPELLEVLVP